MGIRFLCDHCQQLLNVKTHQAGKAGVCPECKQRIKVPKNSTVTSTETPATKALDHQKTVAASKRQKPDFNEKPDDGSFLLDKPVNLWLLPNAPDPIETGMKKVWYIRHPSDGETGPIKGKNFLKLIKDNKVDSSCYVWREDWEDWIRADLVFRELKFPKGENDGKDRVFTDPNCPIPKSFLKKATAEERQKMRLQFLLVIAIIVGIATIGLLAWWLANLL